MKANPHLSENKIFGNRAFGIQIADYGRGTLVCSANLLKVLLYDLGVVGTERHSWKSIRKRQCGELVGSCLVR